MVDVLGGDAASGSVPHLRSVGGPGDQDADEPAGALARLVATAQAALGAAAELVDRDLVALPSTRRSALRERLAALAGETSAVAHALAPAGPHRDAPRASDVAARRCHPSSPQDHGVLRLQTTDPERAGASRPAADVDELTGVLTRRAGLADLELALLRCRAAEVHLVVGVADVDGLRGINNRLGYQAGDRLLQELGTALRRAVRSYDVVARMGGDQFVCGFVGQTLGLARWRLDAVAAGFATGTGGASVSVAAAELADGDTVHDLVRTAERELRWTRSRAPSRRP